MSVSINGTNGLVFSDGTSQNTSPFTGGLGFRNRIINGSMQIDQRNAGAAVTIGVNGFYTVDRWRAEASQASKISVQQNAGVIAPPSGFSKYVGITSLSAYSISSTDIFKFGQKIEGYNVTDFGWGTSSAIPITISFWVRSSLTGTFGGSLLCGLVDVSFPFIYTISSANTWTQITINVPGPTIGSWEAANSNSIELIFGLGVGSTWSGTAGSWQSANYQSATGAKSVVGTNGATFYITGVQLEKGSTATSFDYRPYGTELQLCQRYYQNCNYGGTWYMNGSGMFVDFEDVAMGSICFPVVMRTNPTVTLWAGSTNTIRSYGALPAKNVTGVNVTIYGVASVFHDGGYTIGRPYGATWQASAEL